MPTEKRYNGWTNYETWAVKLWMDNDEGSYHYWQDVTRQTWKDAEATQYADRSTIARMALADTLKNEHEEALPKLQGFASDLLTAALGDVDWYEIANSLLEDHCTDDEDDKYEAKD